MLCGLVHENHFGMYHRNMANISEFRNTLQQRTSRAHRCFGEILERCSTRMRSAARSGALQLLYDVPEFMIGHSSYDVGEAIMYLMAQLTQAGFTVSYVFPRSIMISWGSAAPPPIMIPQAPPALLLPPPQPTAAASGGRGRGRGRGATPQYPLPKHQPLQPLQPLQPPQPSHARIHSGKLTLDI